MAFITIIMGLSVSETLLNSMFIISAGKKKPGVKLKTKIIARCEKSKRKNNINKMLRVSEESFINHNFAILGLVDHYKCNLVISSSRIRMITVLAELLFGQKQRK